MRHLHVSLALAAVVLAGCVSPPPPDAGTVVGVDAAREASSSGASPAGLEPVSVARAPGGYALRVWEDRAYVATFTAAEGVSIFDVSDATAPRHLGGLLGELARSVDVLDYGERVAVAISTGDDLKVFDVTDPADPVELAALGFPSHNVAAHRGAGIVYNSRNLWDGFGAVEIVDARDPDAIRLDKVWTFPLTAQDGSLVASSGCHDVTVVEATARAYCAGYEQSLVWDLTDPWEPVVLTAISNPAITDHHTAFPILDHSILVIGDEFAANLAWGCLGHPAPPPASDAQAPAGALWFYDLATTPPTPLSWLGAPTTLPDPDDPRVVDALCTSHNGQELGDGTGIVAYGWFNAGVVLVDASDPRRPVVLDRDDVGGAVGDARWYGGHVFAVDDRVGLTVLRPTTA